MQLPGKEKCNRSQSCLEQTLHPLVHPEHRAPSANVWMNRLLRYTQFARYLLWCGKVLIWLRTSTMGMITLFQDSSRFPDSWDCNCYRTIPLNLLCCIRSGQRPGSQEPLLMDMLERLDSTLVQHALLLYARRLSASCQGIEGLLETLGHDTFLSVLKEDSEGKGGRVRCYLTNLSVLTLHAITAYIYLMGNATSRLPTHVVAWAPVPADNTTP